MWEEVFFTERLSFFRGSLCAWPFCIVCIAGAVAMATANPDFVVGVVCRGHLSDNPGVIHMTPGGCGFILLDSLTSQLVLEAIP